VNANGVNFKISDKISRSDVISGYLVSHNISVFAVTETHLVNNEKLNTLAQYDSVCYGRQNRAGGTGIIFLRSLDCIDVTPSFDLSDCLEFTAVAFTIHSNTFLFCSIYLQAEHLTDCRFLFEKKMVI